MHAHDHDVDGVESLRPKGSRIDEPGATDAARAAAAGRWDALVPTGMVRLQRAAGNAGVAAALADEERSPVHGVVGSGGRQLEPAVREDMEARLGSDFSDVRVHDDGAAHDSAVAVNAHAYTVGSDIVFQRERYDPSSEAGRVTLAHELTHVVQQRSGPVDGEPAAGGIRVSDPGDRFEREAAANAERAMSGQPPATPAAAAVQRDADGSAGLPAGSVDAPVQREGQEEDEEQVQGSFVDGTVVQRQGEEEEEEPAS